MYLSDLNSVWLEADISSPIGSIIEVYLWQLSKELTKQFQNFQASRRCQSSSLPLGNPLHFCRVYIRSWKLPFSPRMCQQEIFPPKYGQLQEDLRGLLSTKCQTSALLALLAERSLIFLWYPILNISCLKGLAELTLCPFWTTATRQCHCLQSVS